MLMYKDLHDEAFEGEWPSNREVLRAMKVEAMRRGRTVRWKVFEVGPSDHLPTLEWRHYLRERREQAAEDLVDAARSADPDTPWEEASEEVQAARSYMSPERELALKRFHRRNRRWKKRFERQRREALGTIRVPMQSLNAVITWLGMLPEACEGEWMSKRLADILKENGYKAGEGMGSNPETMESEGRYIVGQCIGTLERGAGIMGRTLAGYIKSWREKYGIKPAVLIRQQVSDSNWRTDRELAIEPVLKGNYARSADILLQMMDIEEPAAAGDKEWIRKIFSDPRLVSHHQKLWQMMREHRYAGYGSAVQHRGRFLVRKFLLRHGWRIKPQDLVAA